MVRVITTWIACALVGCATAGGGASAPAPASSNSESAAATPAPPGLFFWWDCEADEAEHDDGAPCSVRWKSGERPAGNLDGALFDSADSFRGFVRELQRVIAEAKASGVREAVP